MVNVINDTGTIVTTDSPIVTFKQSIDYTEYMPPAIEGNEFYQTLVDAWGSQENLYLYQPINLLRQLRDNTISTDDGQLLLWKIARRGIALPNTDNELNYLNYLNDNISLYYRTAGNSPAFVSFLSFITATQLTFEPLYATLTNTNPPILDINSLMPNIPAEQLITNGGTYYPTPYYDIYYDATLSPDFNYTLVRNIVIQLAPIYLVLKDFAGEAETDVTLSVGTTQAFARIKQYCT